MNKLKIQKMIKKSYMLETTRVRLVSLYDHTSAYLKSLTDERAKLVTLLSHENETNKQEIFQRLNYLNTVNEIYLKIAKIENDLKELEEMDLSEEVELCKLLKEDVEKLNEELLNNKVEVIDFLTPEENEDKENVLVELSAGVGGLESRIFCGEIFEMYRMYSEFRQWSFQPMKIFTDITEMGEMMRQARVEISGRNVFKYMKYESGVHRVQRVPRTEAKGRIHTSTVGVVVTPKPDKIMIEINAKDLKVETKTAGGPGGQHVNKTESAVRLTHLPTGITVYSDEERHQKQNRAQAMAYLEHKLYQRAYEEQLNKRQANRKLQIGSSSRSERIRTYNFIQDRITDHRLKENFQGIQRFLAGGAQLHSMIQNLRHEQQIELLSEIIENFNNKTN